MPGVRDLPARIAIELRASPILPISVVALGLTIFLTVNEAGFNATYWYPIGLLLLALLVIAVVALPLPARPPRLVTMAALLLAGYAAWSYLSITWASQNADAWDGANRTAMYACVFALFALWPLGRRHAPVIIGVLTLAIVVIAVVGLLIADPTKELDFVGGRYAWPTYPNGTVALWFMAFWPCVVAGSRRELHPALRGVFLAGAVILAGITLTSQSRGWLFSLPIVTVLFLLIVPNRVRTTFTLLGVGVVAVIIAPTALDVFHAFGNGGPVQPALDSAQRTILVAAVLTGMVTGFVAFFDRRIDFKPQTTARAGRWMLRTAGAVVVVGLIGFVVSVGSPLSWLGDRWDEFKSAPEPTTESARFTQTLGSNRYDFWRVAWGRFEAHPIQGIGADNFRQDYLLERKSDEEPYYPHSMIVRTFSQTGLVGVLLLGGALACALMAALRAARRRTGLAAATAGAATTSFIYFAVHGSVDWFWELPALGCIGFASLGLAAGLMPREPAPPWVSRRRPLASGVRPLAATVVVAGLVFASFLGPWQSARYSESARVLYNEHPTEWQKAIDRLDRAAALDPFQPRPRILQAKIDFALGQLELSARDFQAAIDRDHRYQYAYVALAAVQSARGQWAAATAAAQRAVELSPRDHIAASVLTKIKAGQAVDFADLDRRIAARSRERVL